MEKSEAIFKNEISVIENGLLKHNFSAYENRVLWFIFRKTYLWQKEEDAISIGQFVKWTKISRWNVGKTLKGLTEKRVIIRNPEEYITKYRFNLNFHEWMKKLTDDTKTSIQSDTSIHIDTGVVSNEILKVVSNQIPTNKRYTNTIYTQHAEEIYSAYPKKADREGSIKSIKKLLKSGVTEESLLRAVMNYKAFIQSEEKERKYIIQSNNFFGEAERYKEFLEQSETEPKLSQGELAIQRCKERGDI